MKLQLLMLISVLLSGCAGLNPNIGERTTDNFAYRDRFNEAFELAKKPAEEGKPWAQLRLGMFYEQGRGIEKDLNKAELWYKKSR